MTVSMSMAGSHSGAVLMPIFIILGVVIVIFSIVLCCGCYRKCKNKHHNHHKYHQIPYEFQYDKNSLYQPDLAFHTESQLQPQLQPQYPIGNSYYELNDDLEGGQVLRSQYSYDYIG